VSRIYPRAAWGARPPKAQEFRNLASIRLLIGHYSDTHESIPSPSHVHDVLVVQAIQRYHMDVRGYLDIAYGALIGGNGDVYVGRPPNVVEAATFGHNHEEYAIAFLTDGPITPEQKGAFTFLHYLADNNFPNVDPHPHPHSAFTPTQCPGDEIRRFLATV
jgi:hypothetical protein